MHLNNTLTEYGFFSKVLHWLSAILLFIQIPLGFYLVDLDFGEERITFENIHIILGLTIFYLVIIRLIKNIINPTPKLDVSIFKMHCLIKHIVKNIGISLFLIISILVTTHANSEQSAEDIIKNRKAIFSKNYSTAKKVQSLSSSGDFDDAKILMLEMSENYKNLKEMFPDNSKEGFKTESLPIIWEEKDAFNALMQKASDDMIKLASTIEETDNVRGTIGKLMWSNCKACHSKYRAPH